VGVGVVSAATYSGVHDAIRQTVTDADVGGLPARQLTLALISLTRRSGVVTALGQVAVKKSVCLSAGTWSRMALI
jgi:hypothetical protein